MASEEFLIVFVVLAAVAALCGYVWSAAQGVGAARGKKSGAP